MDQPNVLAKPRPEGAWLGWRDAAQGKMPNRRRASASRLLRPALIAAGAAATGLAAVVNYRRGRAAERAHPPIGSFMEVDGVTVHYIEQGEGPPVVFLHGNGASVEDLVISGLMDRLAQSHRVIAIDRPGYGYTGRPRPRVWTASAQAALLRTVVQRLGARRPLVIGHSWGAIVTMAWALAHEREIAGVVLMSGYYYPTARRDVLVLSPPGIPVIGDFMRYTISPPLSRLIAPKLIQRIFAPHPVPRRFAEGFPLEMALRPWQLRASAEELGFMIPWAAMHQHRYRDLRLPVTIITGDDDRIITAARQSMRLNRDIPHSRLRVLPGLGHMIHYFAQDEIVESVEAMLGRGDEPRTGEPLRPRIHASASPARHASEAAVSSAAAY
jgi:pimeloyl-ACP methyl ester carboxylesterase